MGQLGFYEARRRCRDFSRSKKPLAQLCAVSFLNALTTDPPPQPHIHSHPSTTRTRSSMHIWCLRLGCLTAVKRQISPNRDPHVHTPGPTPCLPASVATILPLRLCVWAGQCGKASHISSVIRRSRTPLLFWLDPFVRSLPWHIIHSSRPFGLTINTYTTSPSLPPSLLSLDTQTERPVMASPVPSPPPPPEGGGSNHGSNTASAAASSASGGGGGRGGGGGGSGSEGGREGGSEGGFTSLMDDDMMMNDLDGFDGFGHQVGREGGRKGGREGGEKEREAEVG